MRDPYFNLSMAKLSVSALLLAALTLVVGCSDITDSLTPPPPPPLPGTVTGTIALGTSTNSIVTDNSSAATLIATVVDASNALMPNVDIAFSATNGNLSASTAKTDANGQATVTLKSGLSDFSNRTATITATAGGQSASIPILIKGSTLALTLPATSAKVGVDTLTATVTAADASGQGKSNQTIRFSIGAASSGAGTLSAATLTTDVSGVAKPLVFTPTIAGTVVLTAEWLNSSGAVTATATSNITVEATTGTSFTIISPLTEPTALATLAPQMLTVAVPLMISGATVTNVRISSTSGTWVGTNPSVGPLTSITQIPALSTVGATFTAPNNAGSVSVQVDALDVNGTILSSLSRTFVISATAANAAKVFLSASVVALSPSSGSNISTATLVASVKDANSNAVGNAPVIFGLLGTTGSGETVSPAVVYTSPTGLLGTATTTFSAGSSPTVADIYAQVSVVGQICTFAVNPPPPATAPTPETNPLCAQIPLRVSSTAVSVTVGFGTAIEDTANTTQYKLPGSVLVVNSNGSAAAGVEVTLTAFPARYRNGTIMAITETHGTGSSHDHCGGPFSIFGGLTDFTNNEDINRNGILDTGILAPAEDTLGNGLLDTPVASEDTNSNGILDAGEDANGNGILDLGFEDRNANGILDPGEDLATNLTAMLAMAIPGNGLISPAHAAGGSVPLTVKTDSNGAATFFLQYPKSSAWFIEDEITARVLVGGTESTAKINQVLPMSETDATDPICIIGRRASY